MNISKRMRLGFLLPVLMLGTAWGGNADARGEIAGRQVLKAEWSREDGIHTNRPMARFYRYDDPRVASRGRWQYTIAGGGPGQFARRFARTGDEVSVDFVGTSIEFWHKEGRLERNLILSPEAEQVYGLVSVMIDGKPVNGGNGIERDSEGRSLIDTSRNGRFTVARNLAPGRHRLTVSIPGLPSHPGASTAVAVIGFCAGLDGGKVSDSRAWRYALAVRGGRGWQERAVELAEKATDDAGLAAVEQLYFVSREMDEVVTHLRSFHAMPPPSLMVERESKTWTPQKETLQYLGRLAELKQRADVAIKAADEFRYEVGRPEPFAALMKNLRGVASDVDACLAAEVRKLPPVIFITGVPLESGAVPNFVWNSNPRGPWGCSIRIWDPAKPETPARVIFEDPKAILFDMNLSDDAGTVFFSMRRNGEQCWQIYEMGIDGKNLRQMTSGPHYNVCPVPLPDGRIAFLSSRTRGSHTVCQSGPSMHVHVMARDGSNARDLSSNTLTDFGLSLMRDGRLLFTRWEYIDSDLGNRQALWTEYPDGRQFALYFGNTVVDPATFWQAREIPNRDAVVCTLAPHHGSPYGPIGIVTRQSGPEALRDEGFRWVTDEFPNVEDLNHFWAYRDPCPVSENQFLVSYGGGDVKRFRIYLLDEMDNKSLVYEDAGTSCFYPQPVRARPVSRSIPGLVPQNVHYVDVPAAPPGQTNAERVATGYFIVNDVYKGLEPQVSRGRAKWIRIMEQLPKTVNTTWHRSYDQGPLMSGGTTYYAKRCWGYAPLEADGSAYFEAPAMKEIYLQVCDEEGRELRRMTSAAQLAPGESQSCIGCHENRGTVQPGDRGALAMRRAPSPLQLPEWGNAGVVDYVRVVQPVLDKHCVSCHSGMNPAGGIQLTGHATRFFNMSYDNLVVRSQSVQDSTDVFLELGTNMPLVQVNNMFPGTYSPQKPLSTGSLVSRLPAYFGKDHCKSEVSAKEMRRVYEWIDAMAPYYTTYYSARPGTRGDRDRWGKPSGPGQADWYTKSFAPVYEKRCASCHGSIHPDARYEWGGKWGWIDLSTPEWSPALIAHLDKSAGGRGVTEKDFGKLLNKRWTERRSWLICRWESIQSDYRTMELALKAGRKVEIFKDINDPDYQAMLQAIRDGKKSTDELPEADMPGFVNHTANGAFQYR